MKNQFLALIAVPMILLTSAAGWATEIKCSSEARGLKTQLIFSSTKPQLEVTGSMNGLALKPYAFLTSYAACGQTMVEPATCTSSEGILADQPDTYLFQFTCTDGRKGSLRFQQGNAVAVCYAADGVLANQQSGQSCQISQK